MIEAVPRWGGGARGRDTHEKRVFHACHPREEHRHPGRVDRTRNCQRPRRHCQIETTLRCSSGDTRELTYRAISRRSSMVRVALVVAALSAALLPACTSCAPPPATGCATNADCLNGENCDPTTKLCTSSNEGEGEGTSAAEGEGTSSGEGEGTSSGEGEGTSSGEGEGEG